MCHEKILNIIGGTLTNQVLKLAMAMCCPGLGHGAPITVPR